MISEYWVEMKANFGLSTSNGVNLWQQKISTLWLYSAIRLKLFYNQLIKISFPNIVYPAVISKHKSTLKNGSEGIVPLPSLGVIQ